MCARQPPFEPDPDTWTWALFGAGPPKHERITDARLVEVIGELPDWCLIVEAKVDGRTYEVNLESSCKLPIPAGYRAAIEQALVDGLLTRHENLWKGRRGEYCNGVWHPENAIVVRISTP